MDLLSSSPRPRNGGRAWFSRQPYRYLRQTALQEESVGRDTENLAWWYVATLGVYARGGGWVGNGGPAWSAWSPGIKEKLVPLIRRDGSVEGRSFDDTVVRTSLLQLTLEVYYRYKYAFTPR